jgi:hypothetical protein
MWSRRRTVPAWLGRLLGAGRPELTCEQCFTMLDRYVELELAGAEPEAAITGMRAHLEGCPACREEHDLLLGYVASEVR